MAAATVSRQVGSGGDEVAARVAEQLGWCYFDKALMAIVARERGLSEANVVDFSEDCYRGRTIVDMLLGRIPAVSEGAGRDPDAHRGTLATDASPLDTEAAVVAVSGAIRRLAERRDVVVVGRGGQAVLRGLPGVLHVRVVANQDDRLRRVMESAGRARKAALSIIHERDRATAQYLRRFHEVDWEDPALYHVTLNTSLLGLETAADLVAAAARRLGAAPFPR